MTCENETHFGIHQQLLAFYGVDTVDFAVCSWVRKSSDSGRNVDLNYQPWSERHVTATHSLNRQKVKLIEKNQHFSWRAIAGKLNFGLSVVSEIIAGLGLQQTPH